MSDQVIDYDGDICEIVDKTSSSICVKIEKKTPQGVTHNQWFSIEQFEKRFKKKNI